MIQQAPGIFLSLPPSADIIDMHQVWLFTRLLGIQIQFFIFVWQVLNSLCTLPPALAIVSQNKDLYGILPDMVYSHSMPDVLQVPPWILFQFNGLTVVAPSAFTVH